MLRGVACAGSAAGGCCESFCFANCDPGMDGLSVDGIGSGGRFSVFKGWFVPGLIAAVATKISLL